MEKTKPKERSPLLSKELDEILRTDIVCCIQREQKNGMREIVNQIKESFDVDGDYVELWDIFDKVIQCGQYGSQPVGGPIWVMDFSVENMKKLCPKHPWLEVFFSENNDASADAFSQSFLRWFEKRAHSYIMSFGLCYVFLTFGKNEKKSLIGERFYAPAAFLDVLQAVLRCGQIKRLNPSRKFSQKVRQAVADGNYLTYLVAKDGFHRRYPSYACFGQIRPSMVYYHDEYCYPLSYIGEQGKKLLIPIKDAKRYLPLVVYDLMQLIGQLSKKLSDIPKFATESENSRLRSLDKQYPYGGGGMRFCFRHRILLDNGKFILPMREWSYLGQHPLSYPILPEWNPVWYLNFEPKEKWRLLG